MKAERWQKVDDLLDGALELEASQRGAFLEQACEGDEELRREVESLLAAHLKAGSFIEESPAEEFTQLFEREQFQAIVGQSFGRYTILSLLGTGGMGQVYRARDTTLGREVAVKLLPAAFTQDAERVRRFKQEARAASSLNHPNIITIYEIGHANDVHFIVTEFIEGHTLREQMAGARIRLRESLNVAIQAASALAAAHKAGIVHRDVKPENIMLRPDGLAKMLDFGLAKLAEIQSPTADGQTSILARAQTKTGVVMGTVTYMSPEQARGLAVDARSDIFSLGIVIYEMIAGRLPFDGATMSDVIVSILEKEPAPLEGYAPEVPRELERIVKKALAKLCDGRYQTVKDLLIDLQNLKEELELQAKLGTAPQASLQDAASATTVAQRAVDTDGKSAIQAGETESARATSSAEYLIGEIKKHKRAGVLGFVTLVIAITAFVSFWVMNKPKTPVLDATVKSIAVLPFKPLAADSRNESLELGMADTLINKLSSIGRLIVRPVSAVRKYTGLEQDPTAAGRELGVDYVLEGNLQLVGNRTRATVRLLSVKDGSAIWTDKCDEQCSNIFELQDTIAERIAAVLALRLTGEEKTRLAKHYTENPEAYQLYSLGTYYLRKNTKEDWEKSIGYFEQAINKDPNYAWAYNSLGEAYWALGSRGLWRPDESLKKIEWATERALELDDTLAEAHTARASFKFKRWDWAGAEREFKHALELDPNSSRANGVYSVFLTDSGRADEALPYAKRADQLSVTKRPALVPYVYFCARHYDVAIELWLKPEENDPSAPDGNIRLAEAYVANGMYEEAIAEMQRVIGDLNDPERWDGYPILAYAYAVAGRRDEALKILNEQSEASRHSYISPYNFAIIYTGLGDKDRAFEYLNKAYDQHVPILTHFLVRPMFDSLRSDPRYTTLLRRMNLTP